MSGDPRRRAIGLAFWAAGLFVALSQKPIDHQSTNADAGPKNPRQEQPVEPNKAINQAWHPEEREHHRKERWYWRLSAILTSVAVAFTFATLFLGYRTYREAVTAANEAHSQTVEARRQADVAQDAFLGSFHPIVEVGVSKTDFGTAENGYKPSVTIRISDAGDRSFVTEFIQFALLPGVKADSENVMLDYCNSGIQWRIDKQRYAEMECSSRYTFDATKKGILILKGGIGYYDEIGTYYYKNVRLYYSFQTQAWERDTSIKANGETRFGPDGKPQKQTE